MDIPPTDPDDGDRGLWNTVFNPTVAWLITQEFSAFIHHESFISHTNHITNLIWFIHSNTVTLHHMWFLTYENSTICTDHPHLTVLLRQEED
jgi:hypothetical protein